MPRTALWMAFLVMSLLASSHQIQAQEVATHSWNAGASAKYLDGRANWWLHWSGASRGQGTACLSCHTSMPFALSRPALGAALGEKEPGAAEKKLIDNLKKRVENWDKIAATETSGKDPFVPFYGKERQPSALGTESVVNALILVNFDTKRSKSVLSEPTRKALAHLWQQQKADGSWLWLEFGLGPWEKNGAYYGAALAAIAVGMAGQEYYDNADVQPKVAALKKYLKTQFAQQPLHHKVVGLWASSWLPGVLQGDDRQKLIQDVLALQEADGGWSLVKLGDKTPWKSHNVYPEGMVSDGYATGLVVLALKRAGLKADDARMQKAIGWLAGQQKEGTWPVNYINRTRDPQNDVGKFMRDAAAAFAVLALTEPFTVPVVKKQ